MSLLILSIWIAIAFMIPSNVYAKEDIQLNASYAYVADSKDNREYYSKQATKVMYPASMTKIVTCIVAIEAIQNINETVTIQDEDIEGLAEENASVAGLMSGEEVTYQDLLYGSLLPSGADASRALARLTYGSEKEFVKKMNELATSLKLKKTHFTNPIGLHNKEHYSTCQEIAQLLRYAYKNKTFRSIYGAKEYTSSNQLHTWENTLYTLSIEEDLKYDFVVGAKTGYTDKAQNCVASVISSKDHDVISVLAHDEERKNLLVDLQSIQTYLDKTYEMVSLDPVITQNRFKNHIRKTDIYREKENKLYLPKGYNQEDLVYTYTYTVKKTPIQENAVVGTYTISYQNEKIDSGNLVVKEDVKQNILLIGFKVLLIICILVFVLLCVLRYRNIQRRKRRKKKRK